jgi:hypothetical protein
VVAIIAASVNVPLGANASSSQLLDAYSGHEQALGWAAGWFSVVLLGRILITTGLRTALVDSARPQPVMDLAVAAMAVGVAVEIASYALAAAASWLLAHGGTAAQVSVLDAAAFDLNGLLWGPTGVALLCCGIAMWRSALFPRILTGLGVVSGLLLTLVGLVVQAPRLAGLAEGLTSGAFLFWFWMLWTGVLLGRRTPPRTARRTRAG